MHHAYAMWKLTVAYGLSLVIVGLAGYFGTGAQSVTALIPAFMGAPVVLFGVLCVATQRRMLFSHLALGLALLALLGTAGGIVDLGRMLGGAEVARPAASLSKAVTAVLSALYLAIAIRSFLAARRVRRAATGA